MLIIRRLILVVLFIGMVAAFPLYPVFAAGTSDIPTLNEFASGLSTADNNQVTGIYVRDLFALPVVQQPIGQPGYVANLPEKLTQFALASEYGSTGLLAHNTLAGAHFNELTVGQYFSMIYGDGRIAYFKIHTIKKYQALEPHNPYSNFIDLADKNHTLTVTDLFDHIYNSHGRVVLQTCIEASGNPSWGRMFIIAEPADLDFFQTAYQAMKMLSGTGQDLSMN